MPRVTLTARAALGALGSLYTANAADLTMTAADATSKELTAHTGKVLVVAQNTGAGARTVTITSTVDGGGRTGDIAAYSIGAGEYAVFGPFDLDGWVQTDGKLYLEAEHAEVKFGVVDLSNH
jgi:hypothetical protein